MITEQNRVAFNLLPLEKKVDALLEAGEYLFVASPGVAVWVFPNSSTVAKVEFKSNGEYQDITAVVLPHYRDIPGLLSLLKVSPNGITI